MDVKKEYYNNASDKQVINHRWWGLADGEIHGHLFPLVGAIENRQQYRRVANVRHLRFYQNIEVLGLYSSMYSRTAQDTLGFQRISLNVIKSCTDTAASKIASMRPRPMFLTDGGDWTQRKRAEQLTKYSDGAFDAMKIYEKKPESFIDSCIFGTGGLKFHIDYDRKKVDCEKVVIDEIIVDDADAVYGSPRQLYQKRYVNRDVLIDMFPDHEERIKAASGWKSGEVTSEAAADLIPVIEAWHLRSSGSSSDGLRVICIETCDLAKEEWEFDWFPFVFDRWTLKRIGFFGMGIGEELAPLQLEINKILRTIQISQHLMCVPRIWVDSRSNVNTQHISNEVGGIGKYVGQPPIVTNWPGASPELYQHLESLYRKAYEITGISQLAAQAKKPQGLDSGVALREFQDIESERFSLASRRYEQTFLEADRILIAFTKKLSESVKDLSVKVESNGGVEEIRWSEVNMKDDEYILRMFPSSLLPTQPAGKLQTVQEMMQAGLIDMDTGASLLDFPDLKAAMRLRTSGRDVVLKMLDKMVETGEYQPPEPFMNPQSTLQLAQSFYLASKNDNVPEDRLELLRTFMTDVQALIMAAAPPQPPMGPVPPMDGGAPIAQPEAQPVSDLLPVIA